MWISRAQGKESGKLWNCRKDGIASKVRQKPRSLLGDKPPPGGDKQAFPGKQLNEEAGMVGACRIGAMPERSPRLSSFHLRNGPRNRLDLVTRKIKQPILADEASCRPVEHDGWFINKNLLAVRQYHEEGLKWLSVLELSQQSMHGFFVHDLIITAVVSSCQFSAWPLALSFSSATR
jgi:hypothetical protein